jgi:hypothetical protein
MSRKHKKAWQPQKITTVTARPVETAIVPVTQKSVAMAARGEDINIEKLLVRDFARQRSIARRPQGAQPVFTPPDTYMGNLDRIKGLKSYFYDPISLEMNYYGAVRTISPFWGR